MGGSSLPEFDPTIAADARIYDYLIGGKDHFAADREVASVLISLKRIVGRWQYPTVENRRFLERAVRYLLDAGIRQFIDVGCGMPTDRDNIHQIAHEIDPTTRVVYVDYDPVVFIHYRTLLHRNPYAKAIQADARRPKEILNHPDVTALIDFDRPVAVMLVALLHLIPDEDDPDGLVACFRDAIPSGSYLTITHMTSDGPPPESLEPFVRAFDKVRESMTLRTRDRIREFFTNLDLVDPGLVDGADWHPDVDHAPPSTWLAAGMGRKP
ncbi:SAM-dependent methyltransferase [Thermopolyspora sp. NPDC052614]|uniref:SAM-dependent methyltransferase n=1 Tax=Thermopolyspora sp. NPDC052614 TaxID=3155682 RepID=UPI0034428A84